MGSILEKRNITPLQNIGRSCKKEKLPMYIPTFVEQTDDTKPIMDYNHIKRPEEIYMKLNEKFVTRDMGDTQVMVAVGSAAFSGIVRSNKTAAFIIDQLKTETTKEKVVAAVLDQYEADPVQVSADVDKIIEKLRGIGALDE